MKAARIYMEFLFCLTLPCIILSFSPPPVAEYANLVSFSHDYGCGGSIEYALLGDSADYTYYWMHGPTTLRIDGLEPGVYIFVVRDRNGCEKRYEHTVLNKQGCYADIVFSEGLTPCDVFVEVIPMDADGFPVELSNALIAWSDGGPSVFKRLLTKATVEAGNLVFVYSQIIDGQPCCQVTDTIVPGNGWISAPEGSCPQNCGFTIEVQSTPRPCKKLISIIPDNVILQNVTLPTYIVRWSDGVISQSLSRLVDVHEDSYSLSAHVTVFELFYCTEYCQFTFTVEIEGNGKCSRWLNPKPEDQIVVINEYGSLPGEPSSRYIELLVTGGGECGGVSDLRGLIIDDNNGLLVPPGDMVHSYNRYLVGINPGYIYFAYHDNWSQVPNSSLIVIYDQRDSLEILPPDDPNDSNSDHVYVVQLQENGLFRAKTSTWNPWLKREEYSGVLDTLCWDIIALSSTADGIQVRTPTGEYMHGVCTGISQFAAPDNPFPLWVSDLAADNVVCRFVRGDFNEGDHFSCALSNEALASPGLPNSSINEGLIARLLNCELEGGEPTLEGDQPIAPIDGLQITKIADVTSFDSLGQTIAYTITVTNTGNSVLTNVVVSDPLTGFTTTIPVLLPCESRTFKTFYQVDCKTLANMAGLQNIATATAGEFLSGIISATDTAHVGNNSIALQIIKQISDNTPSPGDSVRFLLTLSNTSPNNATGISVKDYLPVDGYTGIYGISHGGQIASSNDSLVEIVWTDLSLPSGGQLTLTFDVVVLPDGTYRNCAAIIRTDQFNVTAPPCNNDPEKPGISSCVEPDVQGSACQLDVTETNRYYSPNGTPNNPWDDAFFIELLVNMPPGVSGSIWTFNAPGGLSFTGAVGVPTIIGPLPLGTPSGNATITVQTEGGTCTGFLPVNAPAALGNYAWLDKNENGLQDATETGIAGMQVALIQNQDTIASTTTDGSGHYLFTNLPSGTYRVAFTPPPSDWELAHSIDFEAGTWGAYPSISGQNGFSFSGNGATGAPNDKCVVSTLTGAGNFISIMQQLNSDYEYRIIWNFKNNATTAIEKRVQYRYSTSPGATGTDIGGPRLIPRRPHSLPGVEDTSAVFSGLSGNYHLILARAPLSSNSPLGSCFFDNFRLERRRISPSGSNYSPTLQNVGNNESIDSDIDASGLSDPITLVGGQIYMDMDAGFTNSLMGMFAAGSELLSESSMPTVPETELSTPLTTGGDLPVQDALLVYPNPFTEYCRMKLSSSLPGDALITIYSPLSQEALKTRLVLNSGATDTELPLPPQLPAGVYIVKVQFPSGAVLSRMMTKIRL